MKYTKDELRSMAVGTFKWVYFDNDKYVFQNITCNDSGYGVLEPMAIGVTLEEMESGHYTEILEAAQREYCDKIENELVEMEQNPKTIPWLIDARVKYLDEVYI
jgi:hypothetical protein